MYSMHLIFLFLLFYFIICSVYFSVYLLTYTVNNCTMFSCRRASLGVSHLPENTFHVIEIDIF